MQHQFKKATKTKSKLRAALFGPSGSGKTFSALRIATGMGGKLALIDSERGSASKYADRFEFDTLELENRDVDDYCSAIKIAYGYDVLVIDSLSHAWQELLEEVDRLAKSKYKGNSWAAWNEGTPKYRRLIEAIMDFPGHVICTMRSKTAWETKEENGKSKPVRVGLAPEQRAGFEYEFDFLVSLTVEHYATIEKDRSGKFQDKVIEKPGEELGKDLINWLSEGADAPVKPEKVNGEPQMTWNEWGLRRVRACRTVEQLEKVMEEIKVKYKDAWTEEVRLEANLILAKTEQSKAEGVPA